MAITLAQAKKLKSGDMLHHATHKNSNGICDRWKVNGVIQTWKHNPGKVKIPVKCGLHRYGQINEGDLHLVNLEKDCPCQHKPQQ